MIAGFLTWTKIIICAAFGHLALLVHLKQYTNCMFYAKIIEEQSCNKIV